MDAILKMIWFYSKQTPTEIKNAEVKGTKIRGKSLKEPTSAFTEI